jgi:Uma2 family endonuclease
MHSNRHRLSLNELAAKAPTDPDAFLLWGAGLIREDGKFELSRGRVTGRRYGESNFHNRICVNIFIGLRGVLDEDRFEVGFTDFAVRTPFGIRSPDLLVDSGERRPTDMSATAPAFIAEVLSPASVGKDFTEKVEEYTAIRSMLAYLVCSQDEPRAWVWARHVDGSWPRHPLELAGREGAITLGGLGVELPMAAVFRGIPDAPTNE